MTIVLPTLNDLDPVWLAALVAGLTLAFAHLILLPGIFRRQRIPRVLAYIIGQGTIFVCFAALSIFARQNAQAAADLLVLTIAAAIPTIGLRFLKTHVDLSDSQEDTE